MSIYYVSQQGLDTNDGLTPETAWKTIDKVNATVKASDEIRFRRGDTFYGRIDTPNGTDPEKPTVYTSYGEGARPVISAYKVIRKGAWTKHADNVYKIDLTNTELFDGCVDDNGNAGIIKADGKLYGNKLFALDALAKQWDFYTSDEDNKTLFVYSEKCPDEIADEIKICCRTACLTVHNCVRVTEIAFIGSGACCIHGSSLRHVYIGHCDIHEVGGSRLDGFGTLNNTRYGNGIEWWSDSRYCIVEYCNFSEIYDVAMSLQGPQTAGQKWEECHFSHNTVWNCSQAFEIWSNGFDEGTGFFGCSFDHNVCYSCGDGWAGNIRGGQTVRCPLLMYQMENPTCDMSIYGNTFINSRYYTMVNGYGYKKTPEDYKIYDNIIIRPEGQPFACHAPEEEEEYKEYEKKIAEKNRIFEDMKY